MSRFRSLLTEADSESRDLPGGGDFSVVSSMRDEDKEHLCRSLLAEFGVTSVKEQRAELIHSCCLPFGMHAHGDRNASASINYERLTYNCLGCGMGGGLLWWIATCRGVSGTEARQWLKTKQGLSDDPQALVSLLAYFDDLYSETRKTDAPMPRLNEAILAPWRLLHPYLLDERRIPRDNLIEASVGYDPQRNRIIIPHFWHGTLVGWQSRRLAEDGSPKYQSTPDFPKDQTLYRAPTGGTIVVVESPMSVLRHLHHTPLAATFGASVTTRQVRRIAQYRKIILWMDNDQAGWTATRKLITALDPYGTVWVVDSPWAADPADLSDAMVDQLIREAVPSPLWGRPTSLTVPPKEIP